jgi:Protein of unknown function (DUF3300)
MPDTARRTSGRPHTRGAEPMPMPLLAIAIGATLVLAASGLALADRATVYTPVQQAREAKPAKPAAPEELDRLLAPVALYPDQLLAQMLLCASNPAKLGTLGEWLASQGTLKGTDLQDAAAKSGFEPSFVALVLFPDVIDAMLAQREKTVRLGQVFASDRAAVFASIQRLRTKARNAGTLKSTPQQDVETRTTDAGQQVIVIEPANPQVVYVPQYNPQVVYTQPSSTVVIHEDTSSSAAVAAGVIGFTAGIAIGAAIDNDYYYGPYGWRGGAYMYDDAWDDYYDAREDAREDWADHREDLADERGDLAEERSDRARTTQEQRTERTQTRQENRPESQAQREQRRTDAQAAAPAARSAGASSQESRGYSRDKEQVTRERSGTKSDALSGYSSGRSERAASDRGQRSRSKSSGGRRR